MSKVDEICKDLFNVFGIADDDLIISYDMDGKDHHGILRHFQVH